MAVSYVIAVIVIWGGLLWLADATKDYKGTYSKEWFDERKRTRQAIERAGERDPDENTPLDNVLFVVLVVAVLAFIAGAVDAPIW